MAFVALTLNGCEKRDDLAPVSELHWRGASSARPLTYVVVPGDTLYAIAFRYDQDYRTLASINRIQSPYSLRVGQLIRMQVAPVSHRALHPTNRPRLHQSFAPHPLIRQNTMHSAPNTPGQGWVWPAHGRVVSNFIPEQGKKGLDIAGKKGDNIYAANNGVVAYAGSGLAGYGNLIIIKHDHQLLTAYGNNARNLVSEGQRIRAGQIIAEMGLVDRRFFGVHFEIRQAGTPVNPLQYLKR